MSAFPERRRFTYTKQKRDDSTSEEPTSDKNEDKPEAKKEREKKTKDGEREKDSDGSKGSKDSEDSRGSKDSIDSKDSKETQEISTSLVGHNEMPTFFHIGGLAKECLNAGYKFGAWHFDCTIDMGEKLTLYSYGSGKPKYLDVRGGVGVREELGRFNFSQAWSTQGLMGTFGMGCNTFGGLANTILKAIYAPRQRNGIQVLLHTAFERAPINLDVIIPILKEPKLMGYFLLQPSKNYLLAYRTIYDFDNNGFDMHALCLGYDNGRTELGLKLENFKDLRGSIFQRLGERWAVALKMSLYGSLDHKLDVGGQFNISENAMVKAKLRDDGYLGMVYRQYLSDSIAIMYHLGIGIGGSQKGDHRIGVSWSLKG